MPKHDKIKHEYLLDRLIRSAMKNQVWIYTGEGQHKKIDMRLFDRRKK